MGDDLDTVGELHTSDQLWQLIAPISARTMVAPFARARFVELCRQMGLLTTASVAVAIDGSKFKAVDKPGCSGRRVYERG